MSFLDVATINQTIRELLDDAAADYATDQYLANKLTIELQSVSNKLALYNSDFQQYTVELPNVAAGTPDFSAFMKTGQVLQFLINPREIEWKLPGQDPSFYQDALGPIDKLYDIPVPGIPALECWSYKHLMIELSLFNTNLDLRVTGEFLSPPVGASSDQVQMALNCLPVIGYRVARLVAGIRGNQPWIANYGALYDDAMDDVIQFVTHQRQGNSDRLGRADESYGGPHFTGLIQ